MWSQRGDWRPEDTEPYKPGWRSGSYSKRDAGFKQSSHVIWPIHTLLWQQREELTTDRRQSRWVQRSVCERDEGSSDRGDGNGGTETREWNGWQT